MPFPLLAIILRPVFVTNLQDLGLEPMVRRDFQGRLGQRHRREDVGGGVDEVLAQVDPGSNRLRGIKTLGPLPAKTQQKISDFRKTKSYTLQ